MCGLSVIENKHFQVKTLVRNNRIRELTVDDDEKENFVEMCRIMTVHAFFERIILGKRGLVFFRELTPGM